MNPWGANPWGAGGVLPAAWPGWAPPNHNAGYHSAKYPTLNPILASDSTQVRYDVRKKARNEIAPATYVPNRGLFATASSAAHVRLISKAFPWSIDVMSNTPVTVEAVWDALYAALQQHIADSEWGMIIGDKKLRESIEKAAKKRSESDGDPRLKRIDWLGSNTIFKGLDKMEEFTDLRLLPESEECNETWVVKLGSS
ncbi:C2H2-type domain-containing protein [Mycena venus]|uniref:C2H2-type domain-containing protein n=1 Tax=Mycena venus TaxID=2733690 RepID=A0A8H6YG78_9AGAR|nr:C2H2-type domain-containing protein [Mycena venus]